MEGPSLLLAAEQLQPFVHLKIIEVDGNTKIIDKERLHNKKILDIFSWGKHLVFQFDSFALRVHFMLFGSFEAIYKGKKLTGDYPRKNRPIRLQMLFETGEIDLYSCSLRHLETSHAKDDYDFSMDIMSPHWDAKKAAKTIQQHLDEEIADVLLDQGIFSGVGNIIKNEVLFIEKILPTTHVNTLSTPKQRKVIKTAQKFSLQFYEWRKLFELKKHYQIYRQTICPKCRGKVIKKWTGMRHRVSYYCPSCQK